MSTGIFSFQRSLLPVLPSWLPSLHLCLSQKPVGWLLGNRAPGGQHNGRENTEYKPVNPVFTEVPHHMENKIHAIYQDPMTLSAGSAVSRLAPPSALHQSLLHSLCQPIPHSEPSPSRTIPS